MAPFRQTVGLVEDPGADLPLADGGEKRGVAQLFRGDQENADIAEPDAFQDLGAFRHGQHAGEGGGDLGAGQPGEIVNLILHQRLQWRDDDGQQVAAVVTHQRREEIAERLSAPGR